MFAHVVVELSTLLRNYCSYLLCNAQRICLKMKGKRGESGKGGVGESAKTLSLHLLRSLEQLLKCFAVCLKENKNTTTSGH